MTKKPECRAVLTGLADHEKECDGPMWECPKYFIKTGASLYKCQKHMQLHANMNPFGPKFRLVKRY